MKPYPIMFTVIQIIMFLYIHAWVVFYFKKHLPEEIAEKYNYIVGTPIGIMSCIGFIILVFS